MARITPWPELPRPTLPSPLSNLLCYHPVQAYNPFAQHCLLQPTPPTKHPNPQYILSCLVTPIDQYIKILTVCLCVTEVGCLWGGTRRATFVLLEPRTLRRMFETSCWNLREQLAGSSSRSGRNRGAADEADAIGEQSWHSGSSSRSGRNREPVDRNRDKQLERTQAAKSS